MNDCCGAIGDTDPEEVVEGTGIRAYCRRRKQGILNTVYLFGTLCISLSALAQIIKTVQTQSAEDFAIMWLIMLVVGHVFHLPRSLTSGFWVWKLNCLLGMSLILVLLGLIIVYGGG